MTHIDFLNCLIGAHDYRSYLEIGVDAGGCLAAVNAPVKFGVDPNPAICRLDLAGVFLFNATSDEFFATLHGRACFDLVFIDGLHHAEQVHRDVLRALDVLRPHGTIVLHDCNPATEAMQLVPAMQPEWTGDCWKVIVKLRATRTDLDVTVLDADYGLGVVRRGACSPLPLDKSPDELTWDDLVLNRREYLGLVPLEQVDRYFQPCGLSSGTPPPRQVRRDFHRLYYDSQVWCGPTTWLGVPVLKCPLDLWMYQQLVWECRPRLIVELGTAHGGAALYLAHLLDHLGAGEVVSIDVQPQARPEHARITYLAGSSLSSPNVEYATARARVAGAVMVIADSDHHQDHVLAELETYGPLVSIGSYLIVEDTNLNGHPIAPGWGPGPYEAVAEFLARHSEFRFDPGCERFHLSFQPGGYLKRLGHLP
ncbi:MAG TPA: CmcI family methyltransferase [Pirellulales bacterium]|nr:CmcI family methyltransferase [Pirellulales bacterium]